MKALPSELPLRMSRIVLICNVRPVSFIVGDWNMMRMSPSVPQRITCYVPIWKYCRWWGGGIALRHKKRHMRNKRKTESGYYVRVVD